MLEAASMHGGLDERVLVFPVALRFPCGKKNALLLPKLVLCVSSSHVISRKIKGFRVIPFGTAVWNSIFAQTLGVVCQKTPLKLKEIWAIRIRLQLMEKVRDLALFNLAIDSKLRGCDLLSLKVSDIAQARSIMHRAIVIQRNPRRTCTQA